MLEDQIDLLSAFNAHGVEFVIVGGHAVNAYTQPRFTKDLDVLIRNDKANSERVFRALADFGAPLQGVSASYFEGHPEHMFQLGIDPVRIDVLQSVPGVTFEEIWNDALSSELMGIPVRFISRDHLIQNKLAAGRPRDLGDVDELQKFARES